MSAAAGGRWRVEVVEGTAAVLHASAVAAAADGAGRLVRVARPTVTAVVLGSAQRPDVVDPERLAARGWQLARRRSGGAAVVVGPGECRWLDVVVPVGDPLWEPDVARGALWLGRAWSAAIGDGAEAYGGPMRATALSGLVCMAGLAPGEVTLGGRKVLGVSQRRTRAATLLQCSLLERWAPDELLDVLAVDEAARAPASEALAGAAVGVGGRAAAVVDRFLSSIDADDVTANDDLRWSSPDT